MQSEVETVAVPRVGQTVRVISDLVTFKVLADDTDGAYSIVETRTPPGGGTPPHRQLHDDETFVVLEGSYGFMVDGEQRSGGPGTTIVVRRGTIHSYQNTGDEPARMLIINSPAGIHERFFAAAGEIVDGPDVPFLPPTDESIGRLMSVVDQFGIEIQPPPA